MPDAHTDQVSKAYERFVEIVLALKAEGLTPDQLAEAIVRAAREAGIPRIK